jgi:hypothetical protein
LIARGVPQHTADYTKEAYSHPTWRGSRHGIALRLLPPSSAVDLTSTTRNPMTEILQSPAAMIRPNIPFRLDRLPWSRFHLLVVIGLGITWILDGLEVTIVGSLGPALQSAETLHLSSPNLGVASFYVVGAVIDALVFGWLTDQHGRRLVFYGTLIVYLSGVFLSAFAWDFLELSRFSGWLRGSTLVENTQPPIRQSTSLFPRSTAGV